MPDTMTTVTAPEAVIDQLVSACVAVRDAGDRATALAMLRQLATCAPDNLRVVLELLVVAELANATHVAKAVEADLSPVLAAHPQVRMLLARHNATAGHPAQALAWLSGVPRASIAAIPTFELMWRDLVIELAGAAVDCSSMFAAWLQPVRQRSARYGLAEALIQHVVDTEPSAESLFALFSRLAFASPIPRHVDLELLLNVAAGIAADVPLEHQVVSLAFLVAIRAHGHARQLANRLFALTDAGTYPTFVKLITLLADAMGDEAYRDVGRRLVDQYVDSAAVVNARTWRWHAAHLNMIEVGALALRRHNAAPSEYIAIGALAPTVVLAQDQHGDRHVYAGLFGQVRFGEITLPHIHHYIQEQFVDFVRRGGHLSLGISTWAESGQREIVAADNAGFLYSLLPGEILNVLLPLRLQYVSECLRALPNTVARLVDECRNTVVVDAASIRAVLGPGIGVAVNPDSSFLADFAADGERVFGPNMQLFNQARMWNRIGEHRRLITEAEARTGVQVTHALLMRTDLIALSGNLYPLMADRIADGSANWAYADHDSHAAFIEGIGDRFVLVDRIALERLLDGYALMRSIVREGTTVDEAYRSRFAAHTLLHTLMFEHDTTIHHVPRHEMNFDIYRGRRSLAQLHDEIARDAVESPEPPLRDGLTALLAAIPKAA